MSKTPITDRESYQCDHDPDCYAVDARIARRMEEELSEVERAVNDSGTAAGNWHETYSLPQRIRHIAAQRDYFMRQTDEARAELAKRYAPPPTTEI